MKTILITGIGGLTPRSIATIIRENHPDYHLIGYDIEKKSMGFMMTEWDEKLLKYGELFESKLMDLSVNIPLEDALDLGWEILAECFEPNETGLKTSLIKERWPDKAALN